MVLREANQNDINGIADVHVSSWQTTYVGQVPQRYLNELSRTSSAVIWTETLTKPKTRIIVAEDNNTIVGFVSIGPSRDQDADSTVSEIYAIYLLETVKGRGLGRALWSEAFQFLKSDGYEHVTLWVLDTNTTARNFYSHVGLTSDGTSKSAVIAERQVIELRYRMLIR